MNDEGSAQLSIAVRLPDAELAERVALLLAGTPGIRLARDGEPADLELCVSPSAGAGAGPDAGGVGFTASSRFHISHSPESQERA